MEQLNVLRLAASTFILTELLDCALHYQSHLSFAKAVISTSSAPQSIHCNLEYTFYPSEGYFH